MLGSGKVTRYLFLGGLAGDPGGRVGTSVAGLNNWEGEVLAGGREKKKKIEVPVWC